MMYGSLGELIIKKGFPFTNMTLNKDQDKWESISVGFLFFSDITCIMYIIQCIHITLPDSGLSFHPLMMMLIIVKSDWLWMDVFQMEDLEETSRQLKVSSKNLSAECSASPEFTTSFVQLWTRFKHDFHYSCTSHHSLSNRIIFFCILV